MDDLLHQFLPLLRCPITKSSLAPLAPDLLADLNQRIDQKKLLHTDGSVVPEPLTEALISEDQRYVYPIVDHQIVVMLESLAIVTESEYQVAQSLDEEKKIVLDFYNEFGWKKDQNNLFKDTVTFEDRRTIAADYWSKCHLRLNQYLPNGQYILDVAAGAIPNDEYLTYSDHFRIRICMDFSLLAMQEAARRLNGRGIFILGDMTNIPIADHCLDAVISLHTVYHVPRAEQTQAVAEAYRVLSPGGKAVIVYSWKDAPLMYWSMKGWRKLLSLLRRKKKPSAGTTASPSSSRPELFINQQTYRWFARELRRPFHAKLKVYSTLSRSFSHTFIRKKFLGRQVSRLIYRLESALPGFFGRFGQYPVFVLHKPTAITYKNRSAPGGPVSL